MFEPDVEIGDAPDGGRFHFPMRTVMQFDYGFLQADDWGLQQQFDNLEVKCHLDKNEYLDLVYAMYKSKRTPSIYKPYLEKILLDAFASSVEWHHTSRSIAHPCGWARISLNTVR